jgi:hypothetical protein
MERKVTPESEEPIIPKAMSIQWLFRLPVKKVSLSFFLLVQKDIKISIAKYTDITISII